MIPRELLEPAPEPTPKRRAKPVWTQLRSNRNFMNYPLARSVRTQPRRREDKARGEKWCYLPGDDHIELSVPADSPVRRLPTGLDMNVLFRLLAGVQGSQCARVEFASWAVLLRELHLAAHQDNRSRVVDALLFWKDLAIFYDGCWYQTGGDHVERDFPPPVRHFDVKKGRTITVTLDPAWVKLALEKKFFAAIPLPLPSDASAQNLVLRVLTSMPTLVGEDREHLNCSALIQRHILCRRIGLRHEEKKLERIGAIVAGWFEARAGKFWLQEDRCGRVAFAFTPPAVPRSKTARTKGQSRPKQHARRGK